MIMEKFHTCFIPVSHLFHTSVRVRANVGLVVVVAAGGQPCLVATGGQPGFGQPSCACFDFPQVLFIFDWFRLVSISFECRPSGFRLPHQFDNTLCLGLPAELISTSKRLGQPAWFMTGHQLFRVARHTGHSV